VPSAASVTVGGLLLWFLQRVAAMTYTQPPAVALDHDRPKSAKN